MSSKNTRGQVIGTYTNLIYWNIPKSIDLNDKETYRYYDKYGTLYITNIKTGKKWEIKGQLCEGDYKRCDNLEYEEHTDNEDDSDDDDNEDEDDVVYY